jgi:uncharacterized membrane protein
MDEALAALIAAAVTFVGTHFALSHPLRQPILNVLGNLGFQALYSLVALASFAWMVVAFRQVPAYAVPLWDGTKPVAWALASVIMLAASVLLAGSFSGNPALPAPGARELAQQKPRGVFLITRHPMMWSFALWSAAHVLVSPVPRVIVLSVAIAFLALAGALLQDGKKKDQLGSAWTRWQEHTSFVPQLGRLHQAGAVAWLGGLVLWLAACWAHLPLAGIPAGPWLWFPIG